MAARALDLYVIWVRFPSYQPNFDCSQAEAAIFADHAFLFVWRRDGQSCENRVIEWALTDAFNLINLSRILCEFERRP